MRARPKDYRQLEFLELATSAYGKLSPKALSSTSSLN